MFGALTGRSWQDKVCDVRAKMNANQTSVVVVTALDEVACKMSFNPTTIFLFILQTPLFCLGLFNMRGSDVNFNPVFFAYAIITLEDVRLVS